jgi:ribosomal peptide maturation radical SAM protein 1
MSAVYIVSMPFMPVRWPSLGIGQLIAAAKRANIDAKAIYPSLRFAKLIGLPLYDLISITITPMIIEPDSGPYPFLLAEWLFSGAAFEGFDVPCDEYLPLTMGKDSLFAKFVSATYRKDEAFFQEKFSAIRQQATQFVEDTAQAILEQHPQIVGCSTTFLQYSASLAVLRKIKDYNPSVITMLGGSECEAERGVASLKKFSWVDFVVSGEADTLFPDLCQKILKYGSQIPVADIPYGVYGRQKISSFSDRVPDQLVKEWAETAIETDLEQIPIPDYEAYFEELAQTGLSGKVSPILVMESSRGCWKGQKHPCNFCGLNGKRMGYRTKSPDRVLREMEQLSKTYGIQNFILSDNVLNMRHFENVFLELARRNAPYTLFFETISTLTEHQVTLLADAGVVWIQPGIESLHDELLTLLNKGNSTLHNIALLKYTLENGIRSVWNMIYNIPQDCDTYYQEIADLLPLLYHLEPPAAVITLSFDRFSVYYEHPEQFGLQLFPLPLYRYVYPFEPDELTNFAYFFADATTLKKRETGQPGVHQLIHNVIEWKRLFRPEKENHPRPQLTLSETENTATIFDTRPCAVASEFVLTDIERGIYKACKSPIAKTRLYTLLSANQEIQHKQSLITQGIQELIEKKLLLQIKQRYLALATYTPKKPRSTQKLANQGAPDSSGQKPLTNKALLELIAKLGI